MPPIMSHRAARAFIPALLCALIGAAQADAVDCNNADTTIDLNYCAGLQLERVKAEQEKYLAAAKREAQEAKHVAEMIDASQIAWLEYRKRYCASIYQYWIEGSIRNLMNLECETRLTRERTHNLWQDYLVAMDGSATLPEPTRGDDTP